MQYFERKTNNCWQTLRKKEQKPRSREVKWWIVKLALLALRLICRLIDFFGGTGPDD